MTTEVKTPTGAAEKPHHYQYLKEFRVEQCPLFLQHKCTQHRPFTCFHWHFMNQRRRRPAKKRDGAFNYSPDLYCTNYDETTGICPDGDDCPLLHRTAGDTERRYHLRYYKTAPCVHETDSRGHCVKNGVHCAFSHGGNDLRPPVFDAREVDAHHQHHHAGRDDASQLPNNLDNRERGLAEDPKWQGTAFVLAHYKTDQCKRPPRLCRQGYACPQYHNNKDRRRSPKTFKYRSTPCPSVKHGDEWGEPANCESGDQCAYCHTRTEQQFHPEIYKSTKCNDMLQTGYCPRGPFCAFAHIDEEINSFRDSMGDSAGDEDHSLAGYLNNVLPSDTNLSNQSASGANESGSGHNKLSEKEVEIDVFNLANVTPSTSGNGTHGRSWSTSMAPSLLDVSGSEFSGLRWHPQLSKGELTAGMRREILEIENDANLNELEKAQRKQEVLQRRSLHGGSAVGSAPSSSGPSMPHHFPTGVSVTSRHHRLSSTSSGISSSSALGGSGSPQNNAYFSPGDTVESVLANGLDDLDIDDLNIENLDKEIELGGQDIVEEPNSASSSFSASFGSPMGVAMGRSLPISIPDGAMLRHQITSGTSGPPGFADLAVNSAASTAGGAGSMSPLSSMTLSAAAIQPRQRAFSLGQHQQHPSAVQQQQFRDSMAAAAFLSHQANVGKFGVAVASSLSPGSGTGANSSPLLSSSLFSTPQGSQKAGGSLPDQGNGAAATAANLGAAELLRLQEEVISSRSTLAAWEECMMQARKACDAWKKEAEDAKIDKMLALQQRDEAVGRCTKLLQDLERLGVTNQHMKCLQPQEELEKIPIQQVLILQQQLRQDLDRVEKMLFHHQSSVGGAPSATSTGGGSQAPPPGFAPQQSQTTTTGSKPSPS